MAKNEWENDDSDFLWALYSLYKKIGQFFFPYLLCNFLLCQHQIIYSKLYLKIEYPLTYSLGLQQIWDWLNYVLIGQNYSKAKMFMNKLSYLTKNY